MTDDELDYAISETRNTLTELLQDRANRRAARGAELLAKNPWTVGEWVSTKWSVHNYKVLSLNPKSVVVEATFGMKETIPLHRVHPAEITKIGGPGIQLPAPIRPPARTPGNWGWQDDE
ncbi:hypothetical protein [Leifsonia sp. Leaf264]|uniref:hypothetical protein n=1 Tax=Leifsonia sp. Leaf264 TaxID=1736314 RepID=UPI0006FE77CD|nr:hypothetical protein [Leifsonia sp. Leaf264]KQO98604.1 hypothetical protein ASF30_11115 [Leifsonia sp. Leaf264]